MILEKRTDHFSSASQGGRENASDFRQPRGIDLFSAQLFIRPNPRYSRMTNRSSGFTLLETAVVTVLATVILSITIPKIEQFLDYYRLSASAGLVASELNAGRALAISRNWIYDVNLNAGNSTIQIIDPNDPNNSPRTEKSLQSGNTFSSVPVTRIRFYSRGHARAGTIVLVNQSGYSISIVVSPSGRIKQS
jgi:Tfp pilus assembly protein FimT